MARIVAALGRVCVHANLSDSTFEIIGLDSCRPRGGCAVVHRDPCLGTQRRPAPSPGHTVNQAPDIVEPPPMGAR